MSALVANNSIWFLTGLTGVVGSRIAEKIKRVGINIHPLDFRDDYLGVVLQRLNAQPQRKISSDADLVFLHTATHYGRNGDSTDQITDVNVVRPAHLISACLAREEVRRIVFVNIDTLADKDTSSYARSKYEFREALKAFEDPRVIVHNFATDFLYHELDRADKFVPRMISQMFQTGKLPNLANPELIRRPLNIDQFAEHIISQLLTYTTRQTSTWHVVVGERQLTIEEMLEIARTRLNETGMNIPSRPKKRNSPARIQKPAYLRKCEANECIQQLKELERYTFEVYIERLVNKNLNYQ